MPSSRSLPAKDEELGKKDDDHRPREGAMMGHGTWRGPRRKRILGGIILCIVVYLFVKYLPADLPPVSKRIDTRFGVPAHNAPPPTSDSSAQGPPPGQERPAAQHYFDGPIKFYDLAATLGFGMGSLHASRNVLFASSSLESASEIIPVACDMARQKKSNVHFALLGRDRMSIDNLKQINGVSDEDCSLRWHDARPDYSAYSSDSRIDASVRAAMMYINKAMRPQALLIDTRDREDKYFVKAIKEKTNELDVTIIELPANAAENLQWLTKLDGASLKASQDLEIEILVHAPAEVSASLSRLLQSLQAADYFSSPYPRLTIELAESVDQHTTEYLKYFRWPPDSKGSDSKLTIRRKVNPARDTPAEASLHTVESFYPAHVSHTHVLLLTAQAELSPSYYHYLIFTLLDYKYSAAALPSADKLLGISLDLPTQHLNASGALTVPVKDSGWGVEPFFLRQAPNSNAALYFGDKWVEFHSFFSNRFETGYNMATGTKLVSEICPAWMESMLELTRARGYSMLYPAFATTPGSAIATIHHDLYQPPAEFTPKPITHLTTINPELGTLPPSNDAPLLVSPDFYGRPQPLEATSTPAASILSLLYPDLTQAQDASGKLELPRLKDLAVMSWDGNLLSQDQVLNQAQLYAETFSREIGGCTPGSKRRTASAWSTDDLFCER